MSTNLPATYFSAEEEYHSASDKEEKIDALKKMLSAVPKHKGTEKLVAQLRRRLSLLKDEKATRAARRHGIKKEGDARVVLAGPPNSGKSYLLNKITGQETDSGPEPFETQKPEIGMIDYDGVKIQLIELPSMYKGYSKKKREYLSLAYTSDMIIMLGDKKLCENELKDIDVKKIFISDFERAKKRIWQELNLIKIYTKPIGREPEGAMAIREGGTVENVGKRIHKDFVKDFKFARLWRKNSIPGKMIGLNYKLRDGDILEFHTN